MDIYRYICIYKLNLYLCVNAYVCSVCRHMYMCIQVYIYSESDATEKMSR